MNTPLRPAYAYTERGAIHYVEAGRGEPLLLLHATPGTWRAMARLMPLLAPHFRVIAVDTPGYGNSDPVPGSPTIEAMAHSMVSMLDAMALPKAHILGLHTGNKIAAAMAAQWPDRVGRVVLAGHTHSLLVDKAERDAAIRHLIGHYFANFGASADGAHQVRHWLMAHADVQKLWWPPQLLAGAGGATPETVADDVAIAEALVIDHLLGWRSIAPTYTSIFEFDLAAAMRRMTAPTQVLELRPADEADMPAQAPVICKMIPGAQQVLLEDCDANVFRRQPEFVVQAVLPFLQQR
jgi:pimeloyl-ACP methyl ester carboxylesterase